MCTGMAPSGAGTRAGSAMAGARTVGLFSSSDDYRFYLAEARAEAGLILSASVIRQLAEADGGLNFLPEF